MPVSAECQRYACVEKVSFFEIERTNPMYEQLFSRFTEAFKSSLEDPDVHLSYTNRQRLKAGEYAEVAAVLTAVSGAEVESSWTLKEFFFPLFFAFCMGIAALGGMWRMVKLEKQRLLCELVVAQHEEEAAEKKEAEKKEKAAAPPRCS